MRLLAVVSGEYGRRLAKNVREHGPATWSIEEWAPPSRFPIVLDEPRDFLPDSLPAADLILAMGEHPAIAELIPDIAKMTGAKSLIAPIERVEWLPKGLMNQLRGWLDQIQVVSVFPKPFCTLTETAYNVRGQRVEYHDALISEFARYFGRPQVSVQVDPESKTIAGVEVKRDTACGCLRFVAEKIVGTSIDDAEFQSGMLHHHYPCLASMGVDSDYSDTLLHVSGDLTRDTFSSGVRPYREIRYFKPVGFVDESS